jgi:AraC family transcriptional regulator of adaptative response/methylated-DNA-[protein]-cysteine methyltransferase
MVAMIATQTATQTATQAKRAATALAGPRSVFTGDDDRWTALVERDTDADGIFYYSVATTGVYCRPSCAARLALRKNVAFHNTCADAERAGFRACKRCRPNEEPTAQRRAINSQAPIRFAVGECSLGTILVATSDKGVCAILLGDDPEALARDLQDRFPNAHLIGGGDIAQLAAKVVEFVDDPARDLGVPLDVRGTAFQQRVWQALRGIPAGETASYTDVAKRIGAPKSVRAVARACASNPIAVAIPCHRVVRSDGGLSGYRWGVERKRVLLAREAAA